MNLTVALLGSLLLIALFTRNITLGIAAISLLFLYCIPFFYKNLGLIAWHGKNVIIVAATVLIMLPLIRNNWSYKDLAMLFISWQGIISVLAGFIFSWLASRGLNLLTSNPSLMLGVLIGSLIGTVIFHSAPLGASIAAGLLSLLVLK